MNVVVIASLHVFVSAYFWRHFNLFSETSDFLNIYKIEFKIHNTQKLKEKVFHFFLQKYTISLIMTMIFSEIHKE